MPLRRYSIFCPARAATHAPGFHDPSACSVGSDHSVPEWTGEVFPVRPLSAIPDGMGEL
jgi:hypothetical protein